MKIIFSIIPSTNRLPTNLDVGVPTVVMLPVDHYVVAVFGPQYVRGGSISEDNY